MQKRRAVLRPSGRALRSGMVFTLSIVVFLSSVILPFSSPVQAASGRTFYLDSISGNDSHSGTSEGTAWKTIAKVNAAALLPGDTILLQRGGIWKEKLVVPASGSEGNPITFAAYGTGPKPVLDGEGIRKTIDAQEKSWIVFDGLAIQNSSGYSIHFWGDDAGHNTVRNCTISNGTDTAIWSEHNDFNRIEANEIFSCQGAGILFTTHSGFSIHDNLASHNTVYGCATYGIGIHAGDTTSQATDNTLSDNTLHDNGDGIYLIRADDNSVTGNISYHNTNVSSSGEGYGIGIEASSRNEIAGNDLYGNRSHGLEVWGGIAPTYKNSDGNRIHNNRLHDNTLRGLFFSSAYSNDNLVAYNLIYDNLQSNVVIYHPNSGNQLYNNVLDGSVNGRALTLDSDASGWDIKNNVFSHCGDTLLYAAPGTNVSHAHNSFYTTAGEAVSWNGTSYTLATLTSFEPSAVSTDPIFVDRSQHDFHLQASSPLVQQGTSVGLTSDFEGKPVGTPPDIGSYETQSTNTPTPPTNPTISGRVTRSDGSGMDGVVLTFSNGGGTVTTSGGGSYSLTVPYGWSGQVTASNNRAKGVFTPASRSYFNVVSNLTAQNYSWRKR